MMMVLLPLLMHRHPCCCQAGIVALVTMALSPLICDCVVALIMMALLPSSSWRCCPCCNGVIVIIDVFALVAHWQAGVIAANAQGSSPLLQWQLLLLSR
jgi:hypothetical protein